MQAAARRRSIRAPDVQENQTIVASNRHRRREVKGYDRFSNAYGSVHQIGNGYLAIPNAVVLTLAAAYGTVTNQRRGLLRGSDIWQSDRPRLGGQRNQSERQMKASVSVSLAATAFNFGVSATLDDRKTLPRGCRSQCASCGCDIVS
jgi:hypothetical protein